MSKKPLVSVFIILILVVLAYTVFTRSKEVPKGINNQAAAVLSEAEKATLLTQLNAQVTVYQKSIDDLKAQLEDVKNSTLTDVTLPTVSIVSPADKATISGTITLTATASDNVGISRVELYSNSKLAYTFNALPYTTSGNSALYPDGPYAIYAKAYDTSGNYNTSSTVNVVIKNTPDPTAISISPATVSFDGTVGGTKPAPVSVKVNVTNGSSWTSQDTCSFFDASPTSGSAGASHTLSASSGWDALPSGTTACDITYSASGNQNLVVHVTATKQAAPTPAPTPAPAPITITTPPTGTISFSSDWSTATGSSDAALRDTGKSKPWTSLTSSVSNGTVLNVVSSSGLNFPTANVLRVTRGPSLSNYAWLELPNIPTPAIGQSLFYRVYLRSDITGSAPENPHHPIETAVCSSSTCSTAGGGFAWHFGGNGNGTFPLSFWPQATAGNPFPLYKYAKGNPQQSLSNGSTFRLEWQLTRTAANTYTIDMKVYDSNNTLIWDKNNILAQGNNYPTLNSVASGRELYDADLVNFRLGTNGGDWSALPGNQYFYFGGVCIQNSSWCGPYASSNTSTTTPTSTNEPTGMTKIANHTFDTTTGDGWTFLNWGGGQAVMSIVQDTIQGLATNVGRVVYPTGYDKNTSVNGNDGILKYINTSHKTLYVSHLTKFSSNWVGHPTGNNKILYLKQDSTGGANGDLVMITEATGSGSDRLTATNYLYLASPMTSYPNPFNDPATLQPRLDPNVSNPEVTRNVWHKFEYLINFGTPGVKDGSFEAWMDGTKTHDVKNLMWRASGQSTNISNISWMPIWGGGGGQITGSSQYQYIDNLYISGK